MRHHPTQIPGQSAAAGPPQPRHDCLHKPQGGLTQPACIPAMWLTAPFSLCDDVSLVDLQKPAPCSAVQVLSARLLPFKAARDQDVRSIMWFVLKPLSKRGPRDAELLGMANLKCLVGKDDDLFHACPAAAPSILCCSLQVQGSGVLSSQHPSAGVTPCPTVPDVLCCCVQVHGSRGAELAGLASLRRLVGRDHDLSAAQRATAL